MVKLYVQNSGYNDAYVYVCAFKGSIVCHWIFAAINIMHPFLAMVLIFLFWLIVRCVCALVCTKYVHIIREINIKLHISCHPVIAEMLCVCVWFRYFANYKWSYYHWRTALFTICPNISVGQAIKLHPKFDYWWSIYCDEVAHFPAY